MSATDGHSEPEGARRTADHDLAVLKNAKPTVLTCADHIRCRGPGHVFGRAKRTLDLAELLPIVTASCQTASFRAGHPAAELRGS
jgi:hypothetical protein